MSSTAGDTVVICYVWYQEVLQRLQRVHCWQFEE